MAYRWKSQIDLVRHLTEYYRQRWWKLILIKGALKVLMYTGLRIGGEGGEGWNIHSNFEKVFVAIRFYKLFLSSSTTFIKFIDQFSHSMLIPSSSRVLEFSFHANPSFCLYKKWLMYGNTKSITWFRPREIIDICHVTYLQTEIPFQYTLLLFFSFLWNLKVVTCLFGLVSM